MPAVGRRSEAWLRSDSRTKMVLPTRQEELPVGLASLKRSALINLG